MNKTLPYIKGSATSKAAAARALPRAGTGRAKVLDCIKTFGGVTDEQMQQLIPMNPNTQRPRRVELVNDKLIKDSGKTRPTAGGDQAVVWVAA